MPVKSVSFHKIEFSFDSFPKIQIYIATLKVYCNTHGITKFIL